MRTSALVLEKCKSQVTVEAAEMGSEQLLHKMDVCMMCHRLCRDAACCSWRGVHQERALASAVAGSAQPLLSPQRSTETMLEGDGERTIRGAAAHA